MKRSCWIVFVLSIAACGGSTAPASCAACGTYARIDALSYGADTIQLFDDLTFRHANVVSGTHPVSTGPWTLNGSAFSMLDRRKDGNGSGIWDTGTLSGATLHIDPGGADLGRTYTR